MTERILRAGKYKGNIVKRHTKQGSCDWCKETHQLSQFGYVLPNKKTLWKKGNLCSKACFNLTESGYPPRGE